MRREADHVEGFSPELAVVTVGGGKQLEEPVVVRPTSETIINSYFAKWVQSYRDLPLLINQWANVVRWELRPRVFLRTTEFLWQEGHTAHASQAEARDYARTILHDVYEQFMVDVLAMPVVVGRKTARERFAGAINTLTCEAMMGDGKALQLGTSHELGQNFARAFGIEFVGAAGRRELVWQTSWGASTRMVGGLIMCHGDDAGLRVPPRLAPIEAVVLAVKAEAVEAAGALADELRAAGIRVQLDDRADVPFGRRAVDWELKGVPVRVELGPRDLAEDRATLVRRIPGSKQPVPLRGLVGAVRVALVKDQVALLSAAEQRRDERIVDVKSTDDVVEACVAGWARLPWADLGLDGEARLAEQAVSVRCLVRPDGGVPDSEDEPDLLAYCARAY
jgi:prolyl-tRNA synthetase